MNLFKKALCAALASSLLLLSGCQSEPAANQSFDSPYIAEEVLNGVTLRYDPSDASMTISCEGELTNLLNYSKSSEENSYYYLLNHTHFQKLILGEGITSIKDCFNGMDSLLEISFPKSLKTIDNCFSECARLQSVRISEKVELIDHSFRICERLQDLTLLCSATIQNDSFYRCLRLEEVAIPKNSVLCNSFHICRALKSISLGENVSCHDPEQEGCRESFIGRHTDQRTVIAHTPLHQEDATSIYRGVAELNVGLGHTTLELTDGSAPQYPFTTAFDEASGTLTISGKGRISHLYPRKYSDFDSLGLFDAEEDLGIKKLVLSEGITEISNSFTYLEKLEEIQFPKSLTSVQGSFTYCFALQDLNLPATITEFGDDAFSCCYNLPSLKFNGPIQISCGGAFNNLQKITALEIPADSEICASFNGCESLKSVTIGKATLLHERKPDFSCDASLGGTHPDCIFYLTQKLYTTLINQQSPIIEQFQDRNYEILEVAE